LNKIIPLLTVLVIISSVSVSPSFGHGPVDQSQTFSDDNRSPVVDWSQSFIPNKDNLIGVDLFFEVPSSFFVVCPCSESYKLEIREGTLGGTVVGTSGTEQIDFAGNSESKEVHFHFPVTVPLTLGTTYFIKIILTDGPGNYRIVVSDGDEYDDGAAHEQGVESFEDLSFRTYFEDTLIGGTLLPIDSTSLILAGAQMTAAWMIPVIIAGIGIAIVIARKF